MWRCRDAWVEGDVTLTFGTDSKVTVSLPPAGIAVQYIGPRRKK